MDILFGVGDAARPIDQSGYTADVYEAGGRWRVGLVAWSADGLGTELDVPGSFATEDEATVAVPFAAGGQLIELDVKCVVCQDPATGLVVEPGTETGLTAGSFLCELHRQAADNHGATTVLPATIAAERS